MQPTYPQIGKRIEKAIGHLTNFEAPTLEAVCAELKRQLEANGSGPVTIVADHEEGTFEIVPLQ